MAVPLRPSLSMDFRMQCNIFSHGIWPFFLLENNCLRNFRRNSASLEEYCAVLTSQMRGVMEDFKEERKEREKLQEEMKRRNKQVDDQEKMIRNLEALYGGRRDASLRRNDRNDPTSPSLVRYIHPYHPVEEMCQRLEQREAISPRNDVPFPLFYGGEIRACYSDEL